MSHPKTKRILVVAGLCIVAAAAIGLLWQRFQVGSEVPIAQQITTPEAKLATPVQPAPQALPSKPSFDVVRINPNGEAVIAGRAAPGATVIILDGDREVGRVSADGRGEWVFMPGKALAPGTHDLSLKALAKDGTTSESDASVVLSVPARPGDTVLAVKTLPDGRSVVLQGPVAADGSGPLSIEVVDLDDKGGLSASGHAEPGKQVNLYLDKALLGGVQSNDDGAWQVRAKAKSLSNGEHHLRADEVRPDGSVIARIEVTFSIGAGQPEQVSVTIQPGTNLWRIARHRYGHGVAYTVIYRANKSFIRDPNLIYPGQVFRLPAK